ncbi:hypothetical protein M0804_004140 [Polistes exclamans]|nr:hypothetical protein M0804_004140 [Polistes exclamans]
MASKPPSEIARCPSDFINVSSESHIPQSAFRGNLRARRVDSEGGLQLCSQKTKNFSYIGYLVIPGRYETPTIPFSRIVDRISRSSTNILHRGRQPDLSWRVALFVESQRQERITVVGKWISRADITSAVAL